jgi:hypothetical protein
MKKINLPMEAVKVISDIEVHLDSDKAFANRFDEIVHEYMFNELDIKIALAAVAEIAEEFGENVFTLNFVFLLNNTEELFKRYKEQGISEEIYWRTMDDLRCKLLECKECEGVYGSFVPSWFNGFFRMTRFALGRFQYEMSEFNCEGGYTTRSGHFLEHGSPIVNFHIPSSGISLTDDVRFDSYRRAFDFFKDKFNGGPVVFCCGSWLLYSAHEKFLPKSSNILRFMHDFEIVRSKETDEFNNAWRVFGRYADLPYNQLPRDTSLRKAYADWLEAGNKAGDGYGVIIFDGEKIIT